MSIEHPFPILLISTSLYEKEANKEKVSNKQYVGCQTVQNNGQDASHSDNIRVHISFERVAQCRLRDPANAQHVRNEFRQGFDAIALSQFLLIVELANSFK